MERESVKVKAGWEYDHYFPKAKVGTVPIKSGATVSDTLGLIPEIVRISMPQGKRFAEEVIKAPTLEETCRKLWNFTYTHIAYKKDENLKEQVRDISRIWNDRHNIYPKTGKKSGVDCDCMSVWCAATLCNLGFGKYLYFRITKYKDPNDPSKPASEISWSHIYPILLLPNGKQITIDCVVHQFNYEEPYLEKKDTPMDLEYLNGVPVNTQFANPEIQDLMGIMDERAALSELGKIFKKKAAAKSAASSGGQAKPAHKKINLKKAGAKIKKATGKSLHVINRVNLPTVALRNGVLAAMKLNFLKVGSGLRYTYLTEEQAQSKGMIMDRYRKLKTVREKLDKIFYGAGGKPENLRKAILTGKGNHDKAVPLAGINDQSENVFGLHEDMPLSQLLGREVYHSENVEGMEGFAGFGEVGQLGEPATAASVAAASTVLTTIAALIKSVGSLFPNKAGTKTSQPQKIKATKGKTKQGSSAAEDTSSTDAGGDPEPAGEPAPETNTATEDSAPEESSPADPSSTDPPSEAPAAGDDTTPNETYNTASGDEPPADDSEGVTNGSTSKPVVKADAKKVSFWENHKNWIKPVGIGIGSLGLIALFYKLLKPKPKAQQAFNGLNKKRKHKPKPNGNILNGIKSKKKKGGHQPVKKKTTHKKKVITLL